MREPVRDTGRLGHILEATHPDTPWAIIEKMRHVLVHDYYQIDFDILWDVIKKDLPVLKVQIESYLQ